MSKKNASREAVVGKLLFVGIKSDIGTIKIPSGADEVTLTMRANGVARMAISYGDVTINSALVKDGGTWRRMWAKPDPK